VLAWCVAAGCAVLSTVGGAAGAGAPSAVRPPRLEYTVSTLPNGLRLILHEDHSTPIVNVQVWYHVGSKDERPFRTGFAHLFEHMMFKGSKNVEPEQHTSLISGIGGQANAYTTEDVTVFWETVPSQFLPMAVWLEADRMATLRIEKDVFDREREVVKEERRMRVENQPYGRLSELVNGYAFTVHPYGHPAIGSMADLEAASLEDVRGFFRTYYVPTNATVVIAGDVDSSVAVELVTKYFGRIPRPVRPVPRDIPVEPPTKAPRRVTVEEAWPLPVVIVAHHVTFDGHPDSYPLQMVSKILSDGQSSRIYRKLVYETGIALSAAGVGNLTEHPNLFYAFAVVQPGHTPAEAEQALVKELDRLRAEPVSDRELTRAKNQFTRDYVLGRETVQQKAAVLAHASVLHNNDVGSADAEFDLFQRLTAADIQRVANTYFDPATRLVITVMPKPAKGEAK
jgi:zinc protease